MVIVEVGGTAGDIESLPFLEALRQLRTELQRHDALYVHVTFCRISAPRTKSRPRPTQHSVRELRGIGIQPSVIIARTDHPINDEIISKIALFCDVDEDAVIPLQTADNIYAVPLMIEATGLGEFILRALANLRRTAPDLERVGARLSGKLSFSRRTSCALGSSANMSNCMTPTCR